MRRQRQANHPAVREATILQNRRNEKGGESPLLILVFNKF